MCYGKAVGSSMACAGMHGRRGPRWQGLHAVVGRMTHDKVG